MFLADVDPADVSSSGWGLLIPAGCPPEILEALSPLLERRQEQAGRLFRILEYRADESAHEFLRRHGARLDSTDPEIVPGYLLIVGGPTTISLDVQALLGIYFAVGRLECDSTEGYANYAAALIRAESAPPPLQRRMSVFVPGTTSSPLAAGAVRRFAEPLLGSVAKKPSWMTELVADGQAAKAALLSLLSRPEPDLLVTLCPGVTFPPHDPRHAGCQGALLCDGHLSAGPRLSVDVPASHYVAAADIPDQADLTGRVIMNVGSFSAGTPQLDALALLMFNEQRFLASEASLSPLVRRLLGHSRAPLAVIGQVDRLAVSGPPDQAWNDLHEFARQLVLRLVRGDRVGFAMMSARAQWPALSARLAELFVDAQAGLPTDDHAMAAIWANKETLRSLVVLGDPAVRFTPSSANADPQESAR